jgi:hypothetical protein
MPASSYFTILNHRTYIADSLRLMAKHRTNISIVFSRTTAHPYKGADFIEEHVRRTRNLFIASALCGHDYYVYLKNEGDRALYQ